MGYVRVRGIIIKETAVGDADKIVTLITKEKGKLKASAKNTRRSSSRLVAATQLFSYGDFLLYKAKNTYIINSCDIISSFYGLRNDLKKLTYAAHMIQIMQDVMQEEHPAPQILRLFISAIQKLSETEKNPELIRIVFELKLVVLLGLMPHITNCALCNSKDMEEIYFDFLKCGFICEKCINASKDSKKIDIGVAKAIVYVICSDIKNVYKFSLSDQVLKEFKNIVERYVSERLERKYERLKFLENIE